MSRRPTRALRTLLIGLALYSLLGFLVLPGIALQVANRQLDRLALVPARLERLEFNPFTLELDAFGFTLGMPEAPSLQLDRLHLNLAWDSLWSEALHVQSLTLSRPHLALQLAPDGTLDAQRWFSLPPPQDTPSDPEPLALRIDHLALDGGRLRLEDLRLATPVRLDYADLSLQLKQLSTLAGEEGSGTLSALEASGSHLDWQGQFGLSPLRSSGHLQLQDVALASLWPYVQQFVPLRLVEGRLSLGADYRLSLAERLELHLEQGHLQLDSVSLDGEDGAPLLRLPSLAQKQISLDLANRRLALGVLNARGLQAWVARQPDGRLNLQALLPERAADAPPRDATRSPSPPWRVELKQAQLEAAHLHLRDRVPATPVELELGPLSATVRDLDSRAEAAPFALEVNTGVGRNGQLRIAAQVDPTPLAAELQLTAEDIDLRPAQAYLSPYVHLELRSGLLGGTLNLDLTGPEPLALRLTGDAQVSQLHTLDTLKQRDLLRWRELQVSGLDYRHGNSLSIDAIDLDEPYVRFIINEDLTTNVSDLLVKRPPTPDEQAAAARPPLGIRIGAINLASGSARFADFSLQPNFATDIQGLEGRIGTLDNRSDTAAPVSLAGRVDRYAPVTIDGSLDPFDPLERLNLAARFDRLELTTLTPYAAKFAGYRIRKGRLDLALHYRIRQGQLDADHAVVIEQLQLGERVESPSATDLPVRLAVALLKDSRGTIALDLPVSGNLNDPQFDVMPLIWKTLGNLVGRAVSAPFRFIGRLVGAGDENLDAIPFEGGEAILSATARGRLDSLANALQQRPALRLEIEGSAARSVDGEPLARQRLQTAYRQAWYRTLQSRGERLPASAENLEVPDEAKPSLLESIYRERLKQPPPDAWATLDAAERQARMRQALIDSWGQSRALLRDLSQARAASIKDYLVDVGGLDPERLFLLDTRLLDEADGPTVPSPLHLDAR